MTSKQGVNFEGSEQFVGDLPVNSEQMTTKSSRRVSVVPVEKMENIPVPRGTGILKALSRIFRRSTDAGSVGSSSSSDFDRGDENSSYSVSDSGSEGSETCHRRRRSTVSLHRIFQSLNLTSRTHSCVPTDRQRQPKKQQQPKSILRPPVTYTYARGLSGLPTHGVLRYAVSTGLNR